LNIFYLKRIESGDKNLKINNYDLENIARELANLLGKF
jgi:hypothetical protein